MLSMKMSTSWPEASRKYSAIVTPVRPTRARTPGGSFIWPKTSAVFFRVPDSFISIHRSLPSRERSPTPAKTENPPCSVAMLRMSSWMMTVLPTPAPPYAPTLPPLVNGETRSKTLIPVSKTWGVVSRSSIGGVGQAFCRELDVDDGADYLDDVAFGAFRHGLPPDFVGTPV